MLMLSVSNKQLIKQVILSYFIILFHFIKCFINTFLAYVKPFMLLVHSDVFAQNPISTSAPRDQKGFQIKYQQISC